VVHVVRVKNRGSRGARGGRFPKGSSSYKNRGRIPVQIVQMAGACHRRDNRSCEIRKQSGEAFESGRIVVAAAGHQR